MGKDTCAKFAETELRIVERNVKVLRQGFASKLYDVCTQLYGWAGFKTYNHYDQFPEEKEVKLKAIGKSPRDVLIEVGNKIREVHSETWINLLLSRARDLDVLLIGDLRYPDEITSVRMIGGLCVKVDRPNVERFNDVADHNLDQYTEWDFIIRNDGNLQDLYIKVQRLLQVARDNPPRSTNMEI
jgi:hypothetical protein